MSLVTETDNMKKWMGENRIWGEISDKGHDDPKYSSFKEVRSFKFNLATICHSFVLINTNLTAAA